MDLTVTTPRLVLALDVVDGPGVEMIIPAAPAIQLTPLGQQGPPGPSMAEVTALAVGAISALRVVSLSGSGVAQTDPGLAASLALVAGITITAAASGAPVTLRRAGTITDAGWAWTPGAPLFCGPGGVLTHTPPSAVATRQIGTAVSPTVLNIDLCDLFILE